MGKYNGSPYRSGASDTPKTDAARLELRGKPMELVWQFVEKMERELSQTTVYYGAVCPIPSRAMLDARFASAPHAVRKVDVLVEYGDQVREMTVEELVQALGFNPAQPQAEKEPQGGGKGEGAQA